MIGPIRRKHLGYTEQDGVSGPVETRFGPLPSAAVGVWSSLPEKPCHTLSVTTARVICFVPAHALVSCRGHLVIFTHFYSFVLSHIFCSALLIHSRSLYLSPVSICPQVTLVPLLPLLTVSVSVSNVSNLHLFQLWALNNSISISLSVRL